MANREQVQSWLNTVEAKADLTIEERRALDLLVEHEGFKALLGLLQGEKQGLYLQLASMPLTAEGGRYQAAVLQGRIKQIDALAFTLLEQFPSAGDGAGALA